MSLQPLPPLRPRFHHELPCSLDDAVSRVGRGLAASEGGFVGAVAGHHVDISLPPGERRLWSPCLHLEFREEDGRPVLRGLLAPAPGAWTCYALTLLSAITVAAFAACFAAVQFMLKQPPTALLVMAAAIVFAVVLYRLSQMGQKATRPEMRRLRDFAYHAIGITRIDTDAVNMGDLREMTGDGVSGHRADLSPPDSRTAGPESPRHRENS